MTGKLLIAGVGNIFLGDDGFGVEVANRLAAAELPDWAHVVDYGIRGMHLAYDLANGYTAAILIDAVARGAAPGTVYLIQPELSPAKTADDNDDLLGGNPLFNAHGMQPDVVFGLLGMLGAETRQVLIVGCEPAAIDYGIGLSEPVTAAVDEAVGIVIDLIADAAGSGDGPLLVTKEQAYVPRDSR